MQLSSRFTIAVHVFACIEIFKNQYKITSDFLASSINVNPVIIRKLLGQLKEADLIVVQRGSGGANLAKSAEQITLLDIYNAVECVDHGNLFHFHENPNQNCPVGKNIHSALDGQLFRIQSAMENEMKRITIAEIINDIKLKIRENDPSEDSI